MEIFACAPGGPSIILSHEPVKYEENYRIVPTRCNFNYVFNFNVKVCSGFTIIFSGVAGAIETAISYYQLRNRVE